MKGFENWRPDPARVISDTSKSAKPNFARTGRTQAETATDTADRVRVDSEPRQTPANGSEDIYLPVTPYGKPRMSQRDKWESRPCVLRYRAFCDAVRAAWPDGVPYPSEGAHITFHLPMPKSWSKSKRDAMRGQAHQSKPDADNLNKALQDAMCPEDSHVWDVRITKRWADTGYITITTHEE